MSGERTLGWVDYPEALDVQQVAQLLRVSDSTVYDGLRSGEIPGRKVGNQWRVSRDILRVWLQGVPAEEAMERAKRLRPDRNEWEVDG